MKTDTTTMVLNFVLVLLAVCGTLFAYLTITRTSDFRELSGQYSAQNAYITKINNLLAQVEAWDSKYPDPKLTAILQTVVKPTPHQ